MSPAAVRPQSRSEAAPEFLAGGGEMGALMRAHDWSRSPLGAPQGWPDALKMAVSICLNSRFPMVLWWGPEFVMLYNDAWRPVLGATKHPGGLGRPGIETWPEIWDIIGEQLRGVLERGEASWSEDLLLVLERYGYREEAYFTYSYSPIKHTDGTIGGVFSAVSETTERVLSERRLRILRELAERTADAKSVEAACATFAEVLGDGNPDLPFAALYLIGPNGAAANRLALAGFGAGDERAPRRVELGSDDDPWRVGEVIRTGRSVLVDDLAPRIGGLPGGAWPEPTTSALILPVTKAGAGTTGVLIAGINPRRKLDQAYRSFLDLVAGHMATAVANARAYEEERRRAEALAELDRAKTTFFSNISHEFRTPLTLMLAPIEDALSDPSSAALSAAQRERIDIVHRNSLRLLKLVNTLLDFSRIEAGRVRAEYRPIDLAAFTAELASNFRSATERAGLRLLVDCPPLGEPIYVDPDMWEKIVLNLLSNAFKFTFEGEIAVAMRAAAGGGAAELIVRDTGTGIPKEELPRLFERFHRIDGARARTFEGSGIGLALVHELVRQHGGSIRAESELGRGTTFTICIPFGSAHLPRERIARDPAQLSTGRRAEAFVQEALRWLPGSQPAPEAALASDDLHDDVDAERARGERVLLADDNADMREYITRLLVGKGYSVEAVGDGEAALAAARRSKPDLILSDVMMPRLDGFGLLRQLRADPVMRVLPVILLSARAGEEARVEGLDAGADDYVSKPFSARELLARVRTNIQLARMRRESEEAQREQAARLEAVVNTVPSAVWFTHDPEAQRIFGNAYGARLLRLAPDANVSLSALAHERPSYRVFRKGEEVPVAELPLQRAVRGDAVRDEELDIYFDDGSSVTLLMQAAPIRGLFGEIRGAVCGAIDITERKRHERHRELLLNELNHRVKNTLATVQSFAMQTLRNVASLAEGRDAFEARLIALSKAHDILVREHWEGAGLHEVVSAALAAYSSDARATRLRFGGPEIRLQPKAALALSMALHELATNAVKYGALSNGNGHVEISWTTQDRTRDFQFSWAESGGPAVAAPHRRGFGSRLIEQGLSQDLGGNVSLSFETHGVVCTINAPLDEIAGGGGRLTSLPIDLA